MYILRSAELGHAHWLGFAILSDNLPYYVGALTAPDTCLHLLTLRVDEPRATSVARTVSISVSSEWYKTMIEE